MFDPYAESIRERVSRGLTAQRIFQDLKVEVQFMGSYEAVKRYVRHIRQVVPERVWLVEVAPGEEAQVDFGTGAPSVDREGRRAALIKQGNEVSRRRPTQASISVSHRFPGVLSCSIPSPSSIVQTIRNQSPMHFRQMPAPPP